MPFDLRLAKILIFLIEANGKNALTAQQREGDGEEGLIRLLRNRANVNLKSHLSLEHGWCGANSFVFHFERHWRAHAMR